MMVVNRWVFTTTAKIMPTIVFRRALTKLSLAQPDVEGRPVEGKVGDVEAGVEHAAHLLGVIAPVAVILGDLEAGLEVACVLRLERLERLHVEALGLHEPEPEVGGEGVVG